MNLIAHSRGVWIAAATAVACSLAMTVPATAQEKSKTNLKVAVFSHIVEVQTISGMMKAAVEDAKARGWTVETFDGRGDMVAVNNQVNSFISRGFDALINVASPNDQMTGVINKAKKAGIPFVSCFSGMAPNITVDIGDNNVVDGAIAAAELVGRIDGQGTVVKMNWNVLPALQERPRIPCRGGRIPRHQAEGTRGQGSGRGGGRVRQDDESLASGHQSRDQGGLGRLGQLRHRDRTRGPESQA